MNKIFFTKEKYGQIKKDYQKLLIDRKDTVFHLAKAREMGDLSENGYYRASKMKLSSIDHNLRKFSEFIKYGSIINFVNRGLVEIGCAVTLKTNNELKVYSIVGKEEADPKLGKISNESPLGQALLGKTVGETIKLSIPSGITKYKIITIE